MFSQYVLTSAKPKTKPYKLSDADGLYVLVNPNGSQLWRLKYRFLGKEKTLSFGAFPDVSIADARDQCRTARQLLAKGIDPSQQKKLDRTRRYQLPSCHTPQLARRTMRSLLHTRA